MYAVPACARARRRKLIHPPARRRRTRTKTRTGEANSGPSTSARASAKPRDVHCAAHRPAPVCHRLHRPPSPPWDDARRSQGPDVLLPPFLSLAHACRPLRHAPPESQTASGAQGVRGRCSLAVDPAGGHATTRSSLFARARPPPYVSVSACRSLRTSLMHHDQESVVRVQIRSRTPTSRTRPPTACGALRRDAQQVWGAWARERDRCEPRRRPSRAELLTAGAPRGRMSKNAPNQLAK